MQSVDQDEYLRRLASGREDRRLQVLSVETQGKPPESLFLKRATGKEQRRTRYRPVEGCTWGRAPCDRSWVEPRELNLSPQSEGFIYCREMTPHIAAFAVKESEHHE